MRALFALILMVSPFLVHAGPVEDGARALRNLQGAIAALDGVANKRDRVRALSDVIVALEEGTALMRENQRQLTIRQSALEAALSGREAEVARLLAVLHILSRRPEPAFLFHPSGPRGAARSGMILADLTPALQSEVQALHAQIEELQQLRLIQSGAEENMAQALTLVKNARVDLAQAISERTQIPQRFTNDPARIAALLESAETLSAFVAGLTSNSGQTHDAADLPRNMPLPVFGRILRRFGEADAAGVLRPGLLLATEGGALVRSPAAATIRFRGPLLDYGEVIIIEPDQDLLLIFAGLGQSFGEIGEIVIKGAPLGLMPGSAGGGREAQETLYIEVREQQTPVNPAKWFLFQ